MRDLYIKNGHGFIVMYSLTNHQTFQVTKKAQNSKIQSTYPNFPLKNLQDIQMMRNVISRVKGSQPVPILLVANKLDLSESQREVTTEEGEY